MQQPGENSDTDAFAGRNCSETFSGADSRENILRTDWPGLDLIDGHPAGTGRVSGLLALDLEGRQVARDIAGIERRAGESADRIRGLGRLPAAPQHGFIE